MTNVEDFSAVTLWFTGRMTQELARPCNVKKTDWREVSAMEYVAMIEKNLAELKSAFAREDSCAEYEMSRCADIGNLAMMLAGVVSIEDGEGLW